jgi:hypothetical protein
MADASWGFVLPEGGAHQATQNLVNAQERKRHEQIALTQQEQRRQEAQQQQNKMYNLRQIDEDTDAKQFQTGEQAIDNYTQGQLKSIMDNALTKYVNLDPAEAKMRLHRDMSDLIGWHSAVKSQIGDVKNSLAEFNKTVPNADAVKAHDYVYNKLAQNVMQQDPNTGKWVRKPVDFIKPQDYTSELYNPDVLGTIVNDESPLVKHWHSYTPRTVSSSEYEKAGDKSSKRVRWSAAITPLQDFERDAKGNIAYGKDGKPIIDVKHTSIDVNGNKIKLIDDKALEDMSPAAKGALSAKWIRQKQQIEAQRGRPMDANEAALAFKAFAYKDAYNSLPNQVSLAQSETAAPIRVTVNGGGGSRGGKSKGGDDVEIRDVYNEINNSANGREHGRIPLNEMSGTAQKVVLNYARNLSGNPVLGQGDVLVEKRGDKLIVVDAKTAKDIAPLEYADANQPANSGSLKVRNKINKNAKATSTPASQPTPQIKAEDLRKKYGY